MKKSRRLLLGTFLALLAAPVVLVAYSRFGADPASRDQQLPERTSPAELSAMSDFTTVDIRGDLSVEIVSSPDFSIAYTPLSATRGMFNASVDNGMLSIEAYGNRTETASATLRIGMPELTAVEAEFLSGLTLTNFDSATLDLDLAFIRTVSVANNRIGSLQIQVNQVEDLQLSGNTIETSQVRTFGSSVTTD